MVTTSYTHPGNNRILDYRRVTKSEAEPVYEAAKQKSKRKLKIPARLKFATTPAELQELHLLVFINYCRELDHDRSEIAILRRLFKSLITKDNIYQYIHLSAQKIYHGITKNCLEKYSLNIPEKTTDH
jgi:hypothetical protein